MWLLVLIDLKQTKSQKAQESNSTTRVKAGNMLAQVDL